MVPFGYHLFCTLNRVSLFMYCFASKIQLSNQVRAVMIGGILMKKSGLDRDLIVALGCISMVICVSVLFLALFLFRIDVNQTNSGVIVAIYSAMTAILWVVLLSRNC